MPLRLKRPMVQMTVNALNAESIAFQRNCRRLNANLSIAQGHMGGEISPISREETTALDRNYLVVRRRADRRMKTLTSALRNRIICMVNGSKGVGLSKVGNNDDRMGHSLKEWEKGKQAGILEAVCK